MCALQILSLLLLLGELSASMKAQNVAEIWDDLPKVQPNINQEDVRQTRRPAMGQPASIVLNVGLLVTSLGDVTSTEEDHAKLISRETAV